MARARYLQLSRAGRRRLVVVALLRSAASVTLLVVLYYTAPLDRSLDLATLIAFVLALLAFVGLTIWQALAITRSRAPVLRAVEALATGVALLLVLYASVYITIASNQPHSFTEALSRTDGLYFTVTVFSTVGFGDIAPRSEVARIVTMTQMLFGLVVFGLIVRSLTAAVKVAVRHDDEARP